MSAKSYNDLEKRKANRAKCIKEYIANNEGCLVSHSMQVFQNDKIEKIKVYNLPRMLLRLNPENGRFQAELVRLKVERRLSKKTIELDPDKDRNVLLKMLRGDEPESPERKTAFNTLKDDIYEYAQKIGTNGQQTPGLITYDGILINGNRRYAVMDELVSGSKKHDAEPAKYDYLMVGILDKTATRYDLWKNEAKEQISQDLREPYDYLNGALEIKQGHKILMERGMSAKNAGIEISKTLSGRTSKDVDAYLSFLEFVDLFLDNIERTGEYSYIQNTEGGSRSFITILIEGTKEYKTIKENLKGIEVKKWFDSFTLFCQAAKKAHIIKSHLGTSQKIRFDQRDYRQYKTALSDKEVRKTFLGSRILTQANLKEPSNEDIFAYNSAILKAKSTYEIKTATEEPLNHLSRAQESLHAIISQINDNDLQVQKDETIKKIIDGDGEKILQIIKIYVEKIDKMLKVQK